MTYFYFLLLGAWVGATVCQLFFWLCIFSRLASYKREKKGTTAAPEPVSVVLCARNAATDLEQFLPKVLAQDYPCFEVCVVDDASDDHTTEVLSRLQSAFPMLKVVRIAHKTQKGKKKALATGIAAAQYDWLLLTDADCYPLSNQWIKGMMAARQSQTEVVLAFAPYEKQAGALNAFIRFETVWTAVQYMGLALAGQPYMGVGRNLLYKKSLFEAVNGFEKHQHILSGDDDLFVNQVIRPDNFALTIAPETFVASPAKTSIQAYFSQKKRHVSVGIHYDWRTKMVLGALALSHFGHYVGFLGPLAIAPLGLWWLLFAARLGVVAYLYRHITKKMGEQDLWPYFPILETALAGYYVVFSTSLMTRRNDW